MLLREWQAVMKKAQLPDCTHYTVRPLVSPEPVDRLEELRVTDAILLESRHMKSLAC